MALGFESVTDEILTVSEVAGLLKVAEKTVYTMAQQSELPAFKVRGQWRFRRTDLEAWIDAKTRGGAAEEESK
jgi:excisionase family DNA binding protein